MFDTLWINAKHDLIVRLLLTDTLRVTIWQYDNNSPTAHVGITEAALERSYGKCPKIPNILIYTILAYIFLFTQQLLKIHNGMADSEEPVYTVCICHFVRNFGV